MGRAEFPRRALGKNASLFLASGASNLWHSLAYKCIIAVSASVVTWPCVSVSLYLLFLKGHLKGPIRLKTHPPPVAPYFN